jgi:hypothetical protein
MAPSTNRRAIPSQQAIGGGMIDSLAAERYPDRATDYDSAGAAT